MRIIRDAGGNIVGTIVEAGSGCGPGLLLGLFIVAWWGLTKFATFFDALPQPI